MKVDIHFIILLFSFYYELFIIWDRFPKYFYEKVTNGNGIISAQCGMNKIHNNNKRSTNCCAKWHLWQFFLFVLAYIEDFYGYDVIMMSFRERNVQNCTTSYWSLSFTQMSHMTLLLFWLTVIGQEGHMTEFKSHCRFSTKVSSSGGFIWLIQGNSLLLDELFMCPLYYKNGIARGVNFHKNRGARGVPFMDYTPGDHG